MHIATRLPCLLAVLLCTAATAQMPLAPRSGGVGTYTPAQSRYTTPWSGPFRWLVNPGVQKDLELNDDQTQAVSDLQTHIMEQTRDIYRQMREWPAEERQEKLQEFYEQLADEAQQRMQEILLPEQVKRLKQVELQMRLASYYNLGQQLTSDDLAEALGLTRRQQERLRERGQELRVEIQNRMREFQARLQAEAEEELLRVLTPGQRKKLDELKGERFEWTRPTAPPKPPGNPPSKS